MGVAPTLTATGPNRLLSPSVPASDRDLGPWCGATSDGTVGGWRHGRQWRELGPEQCSALLSQAPLGRLAVVVDAGAEVFPVNHLVVGRRLEFRTAAGTKPFAAVGRDVAFEAHGVDTHTGEAWSVVAKGVAEELEDRAAVAAVEDD